MKATKNGTGYIDIEGISAIATAKVAEYIADGYILNTGTMSGSQGGTIAAIGSILQTGLTNIWLWIIVAIAAALGIVAKIKRDTDK